MGMWTRHVVLLIVVTGCGTPQPYEDLPFCAAFRACASEADCQNRYTTGATDLRCEDGECIVDPDCDVDADCGAGQTCRRAAGGVEGVITRVCRPACQTNADCAAGTACALGECVVSACEIAGCPDGERCVDSVCVSGTCDTIDCGERAECVDGRCIPTMCFADCGDLECVHLGDSRYECLLPCDSSCDCPGAGAMPGLCSDGYCVQVPCIDGTDFGCGPNLTCENARPLDCD